MTSTICVVSANNDVISEMQNNLYPQGRELTWVGTELYRFRNCLGLKSLYDVVDVTSLKNFYGVYLASHYMQVS